MLGGMTAERIVPVILSGGSGTRLWPLSTAARPKQFLPLLDDQSLFRATLDRAGDRSRFAPPIIVCGEGHVALVQADLATAKVTDATIIVEPAARNTAPAIALAALHIEPATSMLVMPSDHVMTDPAAFLAAIAGAVPAVAAGALATFGITPTGPETGYGYIRAGDAVAVGSGLSNVAAFVEKPDLKRATAMLLAGGHHWNSGIFLMRADAFLYELARQQPAMSAACARAMAAARREDACIRPDAASFGQSPSDSIDYAVMEGAEKVVVAPVNPGWSDVGSWSALHELSPADAAGNRRFGTTMVVDSSNNYLRAEHGVTIATIGVDDLIIIADGSNVLVLPRGRAQDVKRIVEQL